MVQQNTDGDVLDVWLHNCRDGKARNVQQLLYRRLRSTKQALTFLFKKSCLESHKHIVQL